MENQTKVCVGALGGGGDESHLVKKCGRISTDQTLFWIKPGVIWSWQWYTRASHDLYVWFEWEVANSARQVNTRIARWAMRQYWTDISRCRGYQRAIHCTKPWGCHLTPSFSPPTPNRKTDFKATPAAERTKREGLSVHTLVLWQEILHFSLRIYMWLSRPSTKHYIEAFVEGKIKYIKCSLFSFQPVFSSLQHVRIMNTTKFFVIRMSTNILTYLHL
jgi:hypothetical protein